MKNTFIALLICSATITTQAQTPTSQGDTLKIKPSDFTVPTISFTKPLCFLEGKPFPIDSLNLIKPELIESIEVIKGPNAKALYGESGKNGVLIIKLKPIARIKEE